MRDGLADSRWGFGHWRNILGWERRQVNGAGLSLS
jgi:hypothetical protein